jgi:hypothetical protein
MNVLYSTPLEDNDVGKFADVKITAEEAMEYLKP